MEPMAFELLVTLFVFFSFVIAVLTAVTLGVESWRHRDLKRKVEDKTQHLSHYDFFNEARWSEGNPSDLAFKIRVADYSTSKTVRYFVDSAIVASIQSKHRSELSGG
jgi:hypothetical protein